MTSALSKIFHDEGIRIFIIAIMISLAWHLFWLSTITIVAKPDHAQYIKFSKVSFLGPILGKGSMEVQARPKERSFLETRYLDAVSSISYNPGYTIKGPNRGYESPSGPIHFRNEKIVSLIDEALNAQKPEGTYNAD